jgi:hypothetical protein
VRFAAEELKPDFFISMRDNTPHDVWNVNKEDYKWPTQYD